MARRRRRGRIPTPAWERQHNIIGRQLLGRSPQFYGMLGAVLLVFAAFAVIGYVLVADEIADRNRPGSTALKIEDREYTVRYFTERVKRQAQQTGVSTSSDPFTAQNTINVVKEELIDEYLFLNFSSEQGVTITEDEIRTEIGTLIGFSEADPNFDARFQERLQTSGLSEDQYREMASGSALRKKLLEKFKAEVPASGEAVHYRGILVADQTTADTIRGQVEAGEDFAALAAANSQDTSTKDAGGDAGWIPRGILEEDLENQLFAQEVNAVFTYPTPSGVWVYQVIEKQADRPVEEGAISTLAQRKLDEWIREKREGLAVEDNIITNADNLRYVFEHAFPEVPL